MTTTTRTPTLSTLRLRVATWWQGLGDAWERLQSKAFLWRHTGNRSAFTAVAWLALAVVLIASVLLATCRNDPGLERAPAALQTNPLAPLIARLDALDADVIDLQDRAADLEGLQSRQPSAPRRSAAARTPAEPPQAAQPQQPPAPQVKPWGTTDLDRAIALHKRVIPDLFPTTPAGDQK